MDVIFLIIGKKNELQNTIASEAWAYSSSKYTVLFH
jgi:hypothetical protein